jgi:hypothetical protein
MVDLRNCAVTYITDVLLPKGGMKLYYIHQTSVLKIRNNNSTHSAKERTIEELLGKKVAALVRNRDYGHRDLSH